MQHRVLNRSCQRRWWLLLGFICISIMPYQCTCVINAMTHFFDTIFSRNRLIILMRLLWFFSISSIPIRYYLVWACNLLISVKWPIEIYFKTAQIPTNPSYPQSGTINKSDKPTTTTSVFYDLLLTWLDLFRLERQFVVFAILAHEFDIRQKKSSVKRMIGLNNDVISLCLLNIIRIYRSFLS